MACLLYCKYWDRLRVRSKEEQEWYPVPRNHLPQKASIHAVVNVIDLLKMNQLYTQLLGSISLMGNTDIPLCFFFFFNFGFCFVFWIFVLFHLVLQVEKLLLQTIIIKTIIKSQNVGFTQVHYIFWYSVLLTTNKSGNPGYLCLGEF